MRYEGGKAGKPNKAKILKRQTSRSFILALLNSIFSFLLAGASFYLVSKGFNREEGCGFCTIFFIPGLIYLGFMVFGLSVILFKKGKSPTSKFIDFVNLFGIIVAILTTIYFISA